MSLVYPKYPERKIIDLDVVWKFKFLKEVKKISELDFSTIEFDEFATVPGVFDNNPDSASRRGVGLYKTTFVASSTNMMLQHGGVGLYAEFFVDGVLIGSDNLPYTPMDFVFETTVGEHELVIAVDNRLNQDETILFAPFYDYYGHGGIYRSVEMHNLPTYSLDRAQIVTKSLAGTLQVKLLLVGNTPNKLTFTTQIDCCETKEFFLEVKDNQVEFELSEKDLSLWSCENPALHTLKITTDCDVLIEQFGVRIIEVKDRDILLNGKKLTLWGYCRHDSHPEFGPALPETIMLEDLILLKQLNCNFVRGSHYAQNPKFLALCDQMGIVVWEEGIGWGDKQDRIVNPVFKSAQVKQQKWIVKKSFNNPSVIMRGFLNEAASDLEESRDLYEKIATELRKCDSSRPITYASDRTFKDLNFDLVDIISINIYPAWYSDDMDEVRPLHEIPARINRFCDYLEDKDFGNKPIIISEIGAGAIYGWRDRYKAHWSEEYQCDYLEEVLKTLLAIPRINGVSLWQFCDGRTYASAHALRRPRAFNNKGIVDEYRRPKLAFETVKRYFKELSKRNLETK